MPVFVAQPESIRQSINDWSEDLTKRTTATESSKFVLGWREWLSFPKLGIHGIKAKVDTGARTSALHTHHYQITEKNGSQWVRFWLHPLPKKPKLELECEAPVSDLRVVRDSGGREENRPFIEARVKLGEFEWPIELSLTNRESMKFRMLLGRTAISGLFLVDSTSSYLMSKSLYSAYQSADDRTRARN